MESTIDNSEPGVVIIRNVLSLDEQLRLIDIVQKKGHLKDDDGNWNFFGIRGRHFCNINNYPDDDTAFLKNITKKFKTQVEEIDSTLTWPAVTHLLTLWYPTTKGVGWHVDGFGGNDGDEGAPVYSLTIGNSCIFQYKLVHQDKKTKSVELKSGDIIVFGGCQRLMRHSVKNVIPDTFTALEGFNARINLTFRTCSDFDDAHETEYSTENYTRKLAEKWNK